MAPEPAQAIKVTSRMREAAQLMNRIPPGKFPLLLSRILSKVHIKNAQIFTADEEAQLQSLFGLSEKETRTVIEASEYIFEQAAYGGLRADALKAALTEAEVDEGHAQVAALLWETHSMDVISKLREKSLGAPKVLSRSDWHLQLLMGESGLSQTRDVMALFDLTTTRPDVGEQDKEEETLTVEFTHQQLYNFFLDLEKIQEQLDHLG